MLCLGSVKGLQARPDANAAKMSLTSVAVVSNN